MCETDETTHATTDETATEPDKPWRCELRIKGHLDDRWADWFDGLTLMRQDNGETLFTGPVTDQAALYGLLRKVRDLGLPLLSVVLVEPEQADGSHLKP